VSRNVLGGEGAPGTLGLWWSDFEGAICEEQLRERGITHRLNLAAEAVNKFPEGSGLPTRHIPMEDYFRNESDPEVTATWMVQLGEILEVLRGWRREGAVVNVSCQMGKNRSGAAVLVWLCSECGWEVGPATERLREITALACGNPHLMRAVAEFLGADAEVPLNPAGDSGGWVCISPPGSPRAGGTDAFEDAAREALAKLAQGLDGSAGDGAGGQMRVEEDEPACDSGGDLSGLFDGI